MTSFACQDSDRGAAGAGSKTPVPAGSHQQAFLPWHPIVLLETDRQSVTRMHLRPTGIDENSSPRASQSQSPSQKRRMRGVFGDSIRRF